MLTYNIKQIFSIMSMVDEIYDIVGECKQFSHLVMKEDERTQNLLEESCVHKINYTTMFSCFYCIVETHMRMSFEKIYIT